MCDVFSSRRAWWRVRANVVMRAREPGARKLVFFKLLPSCKPDQESYNCIPPLPPSICDLLIYWRGVEFLDNMSRATRTNARRTNDLKKTQFNLKKKVNYLIYNNFSLSFVTEQKHLGYLS